MSPSAQLTSELLREVSEDEMNTDKGARQVQEQVEDGEKVLDPANTSVVLSMVFSTINNKFDPKCHDGAVRLLNADPVRQSTDNRVPGHKYSIPGLSGTKFLALHVWAIWFIIWRWVWDVDMPGPLVVDKMGFGKTFTLVAMAMICKLVTEKVIMGCHCPFDGEKAWKSGWFWRTMTLTALLVNNGSGFCSRYWVLYPGTGWRSRQHHLTGNQHWNQPFNQCW